MRKEWKIAKPHMELASKDVLVKIRDRKKNAAMIGGLAIVIVGLVASNVTLRKDNTALKKAMEGNEQTVYVAVEPISLGDIVTDTGDNANVQMQVLYSGLDPSYYITKDDMNKKACMDIKKGVPIMTDMVANADLTSDERIYELKNITMVSDQKKNDFIDVRITFPTGEDYIVLSHKQIMNLDKKNDTMTVSMSEADIMRYASAVMDSSTVPGTSMYTTKYIEANLQEASTPDYPVRKGTLSALEQDQAVEGSTEELLAEARDVLDGKLADLPEEEPQKSILDDIDFTRPEWKVGAASLLFIILSAIGKQSKKRKKRKKKKEPEIPEQEENYQRYGNKEFYGNFIWRFLDRNKGRAIAIKIVTKDGVETMYNYMDLDMLEAKIEEKTNEDRIKDAKTEGNTTYVNPNGKYKCTLHMDVNRYVRGIIFTQV